MFLPSLPRHESLALPSLNPCWAGHRIRSFPKVDPSCNPQANFQVLLYPNALAVYCPPLCPPPKHPRAQSDLEEAVTVLKESLAFSRKRLGSKRLELLLP